MKGKTDEIELRSAVTVRRKGMWRSMGRNEMNTEEIPSQHSLSIPQSILTPSSTLTMSLEMESDHYHIINFRVLLFHDTHRLQSIISCSLDAHFCGQL